MMFLFVLAQLGAAVKYGAPFVIIYSFLHVFFSSILRQYFYNLYIGSFRFIYWTKSKL